MAEWFHVKNGEQKGPYSGRDLKQLAASGQLLPSDLVRRSDQQKSVKAGQVSGLFSLPKAAALPPPLPATSSRETPAEMQESPSSEVNTRSEAGNRSTIPLNIWTKVSELAEATKAAGRLIALHTECTKLRQFMLPAAYLVLGKDVFENQRFSAEFEDIFCEITELKQRIEELNQTVASSKNVSGWFHNAVEKVKSTTKVKTLSIKGDALLRQVGEQAFDAYQNQSGPSLLVQPILAGRYRLKILNEEIEGASNVGWGRLITAKRLLITGCILAFGVVFITLFPAYPLHPIVNGSSVRATEEPQIPKPQFDIDEGLPPAFELRMVGKPPEAISEALGAPDIQYRESTPSRESCSYLAAWRKSNGGFVMIVYVVRLHPVRMRLELANVSSNPGWNNMSLEQVQAHRRLIK